MIAAHETGARYAARARPHALRAKCIVGRCGAPGLADQELIWPIIESKPPRIPSRACISFRFFLQVQRPRLSPEPSRSIIPWKRLSAELARPLQQPSRKAPSRNGRRSYSTTRSVAITEAPMAWNRATVQSVFSNAGEPPLLTASHRKFGRVYFPAGGCHNSILLPSGSMTQPNFPKSDSSTLSSTWQPSSRS